MLEMGGRLFKLIHKVKLEGLQVGSLVDSGTNFKVQWMIILQ
jgi:hypothetical protein